MRSIKIFIALSVFLLSTGSLFAQKDSVRYCSQIQFHIVGGYSLSFLNSFSNESALRYKIDLYLDASGSNTDLNTKASNPTISQIENGSRKYESNKQMVNFAVHYLIYPISKSVFRMFIGGGPALTLNRDFYKTDEAYEAQVSSGKQVTDYEDLNYSLNIGGEGVIGFECFISNQISLVGEYGVAASYGWTKQKTVIENDTQSYKNENVVEYNGNKWSVGFQSFRLGVAFRF